ncbi:MAG: methyltransferase domain-containing protein, partial [Aquificae bacterium]|nr:methyltransferase domain-containing protein [Aquificota bacterium]
MKGKEVMAQIFTGASKAYDFFLSFATLGSIHRWQRELIEAMGREGNWLDVGTGTGEVLKKLGSYPHLRVGIDLSEGMLKKAKEKCGECHFLLADAENMPFKEGS